jgi:hypothetical protein
MYTVSCLRGILKVGVNLDSINTAKSECHTDPLRHASISTTTTRPSAAFESTTSMDGLDPPFSRITVEREEAWLRVKENVADALTKLMTQRLATVPEAQRAALKLELERRLAAVR